MKELTNVWKQKNKRTGKMEYIGAYSYHHKKSRRRELALITKGTYDYFRKNKILYSRKGPVLNKNMKRPMHIH